MGLFGNNQNNNSKIPIGYIFKISFHSPNISKYEKIVTFSLEQILIKNSQMYSIMKNANANFRLDDSGMLNVIVTFTGFKKEKYTQEPLLYDTKEQYTKYVTESLQKANFTYEKFESFAVYQINGETKTLPI